MNNRTNYINVGEGGGIYVEAGTVTIDHCLIAGNSSNNSKGGGIDCDQGNALIINCTIQGNTANYGAGIYLYRSTSNIVNTIVEGSNGQGIYFGLSSGSTVQYSDFHNNSGGHFLGTGPAGLGVINSLNANGDSCDIHYNIYLPPQFVDPAALDFHLRSGSPCIDAGDPNSPRDPDGTIADMGAFYCPQSPAPPLVVILTPHNPPIQIPSGGGSFSLSARVENTTQEPMTFDAWTEVVLPRGNVYGPLVLRGNLVIQPGGVIMRELAQNVPGNAPPGAYTYVGKVGTYPSTVVDSSDFTFTKLPGDGAPFMGFGWEVSGWDESGADVHSINSTGFELAGASPNPFNASTALSYKLQAAGSIKLTVFDVKGREVALLADGWYPAGMYEVVWDASGLPSGFYFARLTAENLSQTRKLLLLK